MTTVAELIVKLQTLPADAEVECLREYIKGWDTITEMAPVDLEWMTILDYTSEADRAKYPTMAGRVIVRIEAVER